MHITVKISKVQESQNSNSLLEASVKHTDDTLTEK